MTNNLGREIYRYYPGDTPLLPAEIARFAYFSGLITDDLPIVHPFTGKIYHPLDKRVSMFKQYVSKIDFNLVQSNGEELFYRIAA